MLRGVLVPLECLKILDLCTAVEKLHSHSSQEMNKLLENSDNLILCLTTQKGYSMKVDIEKVAWHLPLHLLAVLVSSNGAEIHLQYLLCGVRLLHSLSDLASQHVKLEQILLEELRLTEQIIDLVFFMLVVLAHFDQECCFENFMALYHATLVACSLHLLTAFVSPEWQDVVQVLLAHPKVDVFMDAAFDSVRKDIGFLELELHALSSKQLNKKSTIPAVEITVCTTAQQCEASIQTLHSLCLQKSFRERLLQNRELCENGGVLSLAVSVLKLKVPLNFTDAKYVVASVSRLKSKVLSMLLQLCESENCSYLDKVANSPRSMHLAVSVVSEVLDLLKITLQKEPKPPEVYTDNDSPKGYILLNSMRLVDNLSNDTNFRSLIINNITGDLLQVLALPPEEFLSCWCGINLPESEEDAFLMYDPFHAAGAVIVSSTSVGPCSLSTSVPQAAQPNRAISGCVLRLNCIPPAAHAQQKTTSLVNILANLHCYVPGVCKAEMKNQFFNRFLDCLAMQHLNQSSEYFCGSEAQTTVQICKNLCTLRDHAMLLIPNLHLEDLQVLSEFLEQLHTTICPEQSIPQEPHYCSKNIIYPKFGEEQIQDGISAACTPGRRKQEPTIIQENIGLCLGRLTEEKEYTDDVEKISAVVDSLEGNESKGFSDKFVSSMWCVARTERNGKVGIANNARINLEKQTIHGDSIQKNDFMDTEYEIDDDEISNNINSEDQNLADWDKEEIGVGAVVQDIEDIDTKRTNIKRPRKRTWCITNDKYIVNDDIHGTAEVDRQTSKEIRYPINGKQLGNDSNRVENRRTRKKPWRIMNDRQIAIIEEALRADPDLQKNREALQSWTEELKKIGPEFKIRQLRKWIYNRKDKLARESRANHGGHESRTSDGESMLL
ncbi:nodulin homeobox isoform X3 [Cryptomeria japonica]|uniref:nodulin homeobox isoform X3 n=1 Tax=Cryptomeria japonica TaxID=3369 RepID=UPI0027DA69D1|nr:nodulin homeobox isoform X3 [Cryptomeria japonica]